MILLWYKPALNDSIFSKVIHQFNASNIFFLLRLSVEEFPGYLESVWRSNNPTESTLQELVNLDNILLTTLAENRKKLSQQLELEKQRKAQEEKAKSAAAVAEAAQKEIVNES